MKTNMLKLMAVIAFFGISFASCNNDDDPQPTANDTTITGIASANPDFSILVTALTRTNLAATLSGTGQFTVFAPTNAAFNTFFASLGANVNVNNVDVNVLKSILLNHVIGSEIKAAAIPASTYVSTLSPFNSAPNSPTISMFVQKEGSIVTINGGLGTTVAPRKGAVVTSADIDASNGVIHAVNRVIQIPNVVDHAISNPNFSKLVAALTFNPSDNFVATLSTASGAPTPFTVFAPTDSAFTSFFAELSPPPASPATLTGIPAATLTKVLKYHVVTATNALSTGLMDLQSIPTFQGTNVTVQKTTTAGVTTIKIKDTTPGRAACTVVVADVQCSNGIIHALDKVLLPQ